MPFRRLKVFLLAAFFLTSLIADEKLKDVTLQLKWKNQFQSAGFLIAYEKGFYKELGLNVTIKEFGHGINIVDDVLGGKTHFGISDSSLIYYRLKQEKVIAMMALFQESPFMLLGIKRKDLQTIQDVNNKKIALFNGADGIAIRSMLQSNNIKFIEKPPVFKVEELLKKDVDLITAYVSNEPYVAKSKGIETVSFYPKDYGFEGYGDILFTSEEMIAKDPKSVQKFYEATYRGWAYAFTHINEVVDLIYSKYNTLEKSKDALVYEAEALKKISGVDKSFGELNLEKIKGIAGQFNILLQENNPFSTLNNFIYEPKQKVDLKTMLTKEEKEYLEKEIVTVNTTSSWIPFNYKAEEEKVSGIAIDFFNLIAQKSGMNFNIIEAKNFTEVLENIKNKKYDLNMATTKTTKSKEFALFSDVYASYPIAIATKNSTKFIGDMAMLEEKLIAVGKDYSAYFLYKEKYPNSKFILTKNTKEALELVDSGQAYAAIDIVPSLYFQKARNNFKEIKVNRNTEVFFNLQIMIRDDNHILHSIINKTIAKITPKEKIDIYKKWANKQYHSNFDYELLWRYFSVFLIIFVIVFLAYLYQRNLKINLEIEKNKFQNIFDNANDGILILTNGIVTECNNAIVKVLGYDNKSDILSLRPSQLSPKEQPYGVDSTAKEKRMLKQAIEDGYNNFRWVHLKKDGTEFWCDIMLTDISKDVDEKIIHVVCRDISNQVKLENELNNLNQHLMDKVNKEVDKNRQKEKMMLHQSRLAQMGEMLSMIAHQWRQPLNSLSVLNQSLMLKYKLKKLDDEFIDNFNIDSKKQIHQMSKTIDDFRDFFKPEKMEIEFDMIEIVQNTIEILKPVFEQNDIAISFNSAIGNYRISGFPNELGQAYLNIMNNAKDAFIENSIEERKLELSLLKIENTMIIEIQDNAGGIPTEIMEKIFDPYFSTKEEKNGTGLGLYMTKIIIEEHMDGTLDVENKNNGVCFIIQFKV